MTTKAKQKRSPRQDRPETPTPSKADGNVTARKGRNIAVAYEPVDLTEEDAEILRRVAENPQAQRGRPARAPRKMRDK